ncbi:MAG TPA: STAS domain-containing protein [Streptomyces sp.]|nr:STAS domain-containing protein [Streptomyces sp.]
MTAPDPDHAPAPVSYEHLSESVTVVRIGTDPETDDFNVHAARPVRSVVADLISQGRHLLAFDLTGLGLIDSTGLVTLVGALKQVRSHGGGMVLVVSEKRVGKIFRITGLTDVFSVCGTVDQAVEVLERQGAEDPCGMPPHRRDRL